MKCPWEIVRRGAPVPAFGAAFLFICGYSADGGEEAASQLPVCFVQQSRLQSRPHRPPAREDGRPRHFEDKGWQSHRPVHRPRRPPLPPHAQGHRGRQGTLLVSAQSRHARIQGTNQRAVRDCLNAGSGSKEKIAACLAWRPSWWAAPYGRPARAGLRLKHDLPPESLKTRNRRKAGCVAAVAPRRRTTDQ